jgi:hypothetical protein
MKRVLDAEDAHTVAQRLGFVLEALGAKKLAGTVYNWLPDKLITIPFTPAKIERKSFPIVERWHVLNNSNELK